MHQRQKLALGVLLGVLGFTALAYSQRPSPQNETLTQRLARTAKLTEDQATRFVTALGPAIREDLARGKEVSLPGLGAFRVVRIAEHKDMIDGRPFTVPAVNTVEFIPEGSSIAAANTATVQPAETVPAFHYTPLPGQTPGQKTPRTYVPSSRIP